MHKAIVTGSSGFIGNNLVKNLIKNKIETLGIDPIESNFEDNFYNHHRGYSETLPKHLIKQYFKSETTLFHIGAVKHRFEQKNVQKMIYANVIDFQNLLNIIKLYPVKKIIFTSSLYVYGTKIVPPYSENSCAKPETVYGYTKLLGEKILEEVSSELNIPAISLRLFFIYGQNQKTQESNYESVIHKTIKLIKANKSPEIYGDGEQGMDFVHVNDLTRFFIQQLNSGKKGYDTINFSSGSFITINNLVEKIKKIDQTEITNKYLNADWTDGIKRYGTNTKLLNYNFKNLINLDKGLKDCFYENN